MSAKGGAAMASGVAKETTSASVFAKIGVKTEAGRTITVPLWQSGGGGAVVGNAIGGCACRTDVRVCVGWQAGVEAGGRAEASGGGGRVEDDGADGSGAV